MKNCTCHGHRSGHFRDCPEYVDFRVPRVDQDIIDAVDEMNPTSLGQRVALENTLQNQRRPTWPPKMETKDEVGDEE